MIKMMIQALLMGIACASAKIELRVALYPYIPDSCNDGFAAFEQRIESEFEALYPEIDLILRPMDAPGDFYDYNYLRDLLTRYDVVEVDSIFLGYLIDNALLAPWEALACDNSDWQKVPKEICERASAYAYPHWQCAYFVFGRGASLHGISNLEELTAALAAVPSKQIPLALNLNGKYTICDVYMDALTDFSANATVPWEDLLVNRQLAWRSLDQLASYTCTPWGGQPALSGVYDTYGRLAQYYFAKEMAAFYIGYSESFADIQPWLNNSGIPITAIHAPWGEYHNPTVALDSFVMSKAISPEVSYYAQCFAQYINAPQTYAWMVLGQDCSNEVHPRYLLPPTLSAYVDSAIGENEMMLQYLRAMTPGANPMPIDKYSYIVDVLGPALTVSLKNATQCE